MQCAALMWIFNSNHATGSILRAFLSCAYMDELNRGRGGNKPALFSGQTCSLPFGAVIPTSFSQLMPNCWCWQPPMPSIVYGHIVCGRVVRILIVLSFSGEVE